MTYTVTALFSLFRLISVSLSFTSLITVSYCICVGKVFCLIKLLLAHLGKSICPLPRDPAPGCGTTSFSSEFRMLWHRERSLLDMLNGKNRISVLIAVIWSREWLHSRVYSLFGRFRTFRSSSTRTIWTEKALQWRNTSMMQSIEHWGPGLP